MAKTSQIVGCLDELEPNARTMYTDAGSDTMAHSSEMQCVWRLQGRSREASRCVLKRTHNRYDSARPVQKQLSAMFKGIRLSSPFHSSSIALQGSSPK